MKMVKTFVKTQHQTLMLPDKMKKIKQRTQKQLALFLANAKKQNKKTKTK